MAILGGMMSGGGAGSLGTLYVRLAADTASLEKGLTGAEAMIGKSAARIAAAAAAAAGALAAASVYQFAKFDKAMTNSLSIMDGVNQQMRKELEATARTIAKESITSAEKLAQSYLFLASAGLGAEQSQKALAVIERFSVAGMFDLGKATNYLVDSTTALGLSSKNAEENMGALARVSDVLSKANNIANGTVEDFAAALQNKGAAALRLVNKDVEEGVAVLAAYAAQGTKGLEAGEKLAIVLRDLQRVALNNQEGFEKFGIEVFDASGNMKNMADIVEQFEGVLEPMSVAQRRATFEMLEFQDRSLGALLGLIGMSGRIREYEAELRKASGTTKEVADKVLTSFSAQITISWHRIKDLLITIGEGLAPSLLELNKQFQANLETADSWSDAIRHISSKVIPGLIVGFQLIKEGIIGFRIVAKAGEISFLTMMKGITYGMEQTVKAMAFIIEEASRLATASVNKLIQKANAILPLWAQVKEVDFTTNFDTSIFDNVTNIFRESANDAKKELKDLMEEADKARTSILENWDKLFDPLPPKIEKIKESLKDTFAIEGFLSGANAAIDKFNKKLEDSFLASEKVGGILDRMGAPKQENIMTGEFRAMTKKEMAIGGAEGFGGMLDSGSSQAMQMAAELEMNQQKIDALKLLGEQEVQLTSDVQKRKEQALELYNKKAKAMLQAQKIFVLGTSSEMFNDLASIAENFTGKQSGLYKAMFAMSKAFAIAESLVKIQVGIANAAAMPWPLNLAAMASVVAATANIVSTISATKLEFAGERAMGGGVNPNAAYLVGERGPEIVIPSSRGTVVPNHQIKDGMGGGTKVVIINNTDIIPQVTEKQDGDQKVIEILIQRMASDIKDGKGFLPRSIESTYKVRRG